MVGMQRARKVIGTLFFLASPHGAPTFRASFRHYPGSASRADPNTPTAAALSWTLRDLDRRQSEFMRYAEDVLGHTPIERWRRSRPPDRTDKTDFSPPP